MSNKCSGWKFPMENNISKAFSDFRVCSFHIKECLAEIMTVFHYF